MGAFRFGIDPSAIQNIDNFERKMVPYICRNTLNRTIRQIYPVLRREIPQRFPGRGGTPWLMRGLTTESASVTKLRAGVGFKIDQSKILYLHEFGGPKTPRGAHFAVPMPYLRLPGKRIPKQLEPHLLLGKIPYAPATGPKLGVQGSLFARSRARKSARMKLFNKGFLIQIHNHWFIALRENKTQLKLVWYLAPMVTIKERLYLYETAAAIMQRNIQSNYNLAVGEISIAFKNRMQPPNIETATAYE